MLNTCMVRSEQASSEHALFQTSLSPSQTITYSFIFTLANVRYAMSHRAIN